jgi:hypothetical protein
MEKEKLTLNNLLGTDNFIPFDESDPNETIKKPLKKSDILEMLHIEGPITKLKEFGFFNDKEHINNKGIEYTGIYKINENKKIANYLLSRTYVIKKRISDNKIVINENDFNFNCPMYFLIIRDDNGNKMNELSYSVKLFCFDEKICLNVGLNNGYISDNNQEFYDLFDKHKIGTYNDIIKPNLPNIRYIFNTYVDKYEISFNEPIETQHINIECKVYDIYAYGGFFNCGWIYS